VAPIARTSGNQKVPTGAPAPLCRTEGCHRRADFLYIEKTTGLRVYRGWCNPCRPSHVELADRIVPRPRVYAPAGELWDVSVKCPYCPRKREPKNSWQLRRTCRSCRGMTDTGVRRGPGRPRTAPPAPARVPRPVPPPIAAPVAAPPRLGPGVPFKYSDSGRSYTQTFTQKEWRILRGLWKADTGMFASATDPRLGRVIPTAAITALWAYWHADIA